MVQDKVPFEGTWEYAKISGASVISIDVDKNEAKLIDFIYNKTPEQIQSRAKGQIATKNATKILHFVAFFIIKNYLLFLSFSRRNVIDDG